MSSTAGTMERIGQALTGAVDWTIGLVSPRRAARRRHFRRLATDDGYRELCEAVKRAQRSYRGASSGKDDAGWLGLGQTADDEMVGDLPSFRARSRELGRDDPIASGLFKTFVNNVVGTGRRPQARTGQNERNERLEAYWKLRKNKLFPAEGVSFEAGQRLIYRKSCEDGEIFIKQAKASPNEPVWFELIEADRVDSPMGARPEDPKGSIRAGVERDAYGRIVAYWITKEARAFIARKEDFIRVPADQVYHLSRKERPGQSRAVPIIHAVIKDLRDLDLLILSALKRTQIAAMLAAFIKSEAPIDEMFEGEEEKGGGGFRLDQKIVPGMMFKLNPGESIDSFIPNFPTPEFVPFIVMIARRIGAALGVSWQVVLKDFGESTYSSARTDLLETRRVFEVDGEWFDEFDAWVWQAVMADARLRGEAATRGMSPEQAAMVQWIGNGWRWIDPVKEAVAVGKKLAMGLTTLRDEAAAEGKDYQELMRQRLKEEAEERKLRQELGLPMPEDQAASGPKPARKAA